MSFGETDLGSYPTLSAFLTVALHISYCDYKGSVPTI